LREEGTQLLADEADPARRRTAGFCTVLCRYSGCWHVTLFLAGALLSMLLGATLPAFCIIFGHLIDSMGTHKIKSPNYEIIKEQALYLGYLAGAVYVLGSMHAVLFCSLQDSLALQVRMRYFRACLFQSHKVYEHQSATKLAHGLEHVVGTIRAGIGEKVGSAMVIVFTFLFGLLCALYWGWLLTLIFLGSVPVMAGVAYLMGASLRPSKDDEAKAYA